MAGGPPGRVLLGAGRLEVTDVVQESGEREVLERLAIDPERTPEAKGRERNGESVQELAVVDPGCRDAQRVEYRWPRAPGKLGDEVAKPIDPRRVAGSGGAEFRAGPLQQLGRGRGRRAGWRPCAGPGGLRRVGGGEAGVAKDQVGRRRRTGGTVATVEEPPQLRLVEPRDQRQAADTRGDGGRAAGRAPRGPPRGSPGGRRGAVPRPGSATPPRSRPARTRRSTRSPPARSTPSPAGGPARRPRAAGTRRRGP